MMCKRSIPNIQSGVNENRNDIRSFLPSNRDQKMINRQDECVKETAWTEVARARAVF